MRIQFVIGILILLLATCSSQEPTRTDNSVEGQVPAAPVCTVAQAGHDCPEQPH